MAAEVVDFLNGARNFALATVDDQGNPRNRFFTSVLEYEGHLVIGTGGDKPVYSELTKNQGVAITSFNASTGSWIRIHGKAVGLEDLGAKQKCFEKNPMVGQWFAGPEDPNFKLFIITGEAIIYQFCPKDSPEGSKNPETKIELK
jgi:uncharacterized pyridoxamine 5'-phosphate oxidase family protein